MTTEFTFKPVMTANIRFICEEYIKQMKILHEYGYGYDEHSIKNAEKIIAEIDRQEKE